MVRETLDPCWLAWSRLRRRRRAQCIDGCSELLADNPLDQAAWWLKCRALTLEAWVDDIDMDDATSPASGLDIDDHATTSAPRPGTSLHAPSTSAPRPGTSFSASQGVRPVTSAGRPVTGYARPGTASSRPGSSAARPRTSRPVTAFVRLGTASMLGDSSGTFIDVERLDLKKYAARPALARVLCDYILYYDHNPKKALELAAFATVHERYGDWWWKARLGKCYYQLGLDNVGTTLELCKAAEQHAGEVCLLLGAARIHDAMSNSSQSLALYKKALSWDAVCVEAAACVAAHHFYGDHPELALRFYRRLLQYDMTLACFERGLALASDEEAADIWYNVSHVAIGVGDLGLAYQALKIAVSLDANHAECYNNLGMLELRRGDIDQARASFAAAMRLSGALFEPAFNAALLEYRLGDMQESFRLVNLSLKAFPGHSESQELLRTLQQLFMS
eukprot:jgi/Chlat1/7310/Chrsp58S06933